MSRVLCKNTKPELVVRSMLHRLGYRFTVNGPWNRKLPGKPDIVLPKYQTVIFVHGCFWHGHAGCKYARIPKTRTEWWKDKIQNNVRRYAAQLSELEALQWKVLVIWTCEMKNQELLAALESRLPLLIEGKK